MTALGRSPCKVSIEELKVLTTCTQNCCIGVIGLQSLLLDRIDGLQDPLRQFALSPNGRRPCATPIEELQGQLVCTDPCCVGDHGQLARTIAAG